MFLTDILEKSAKEFSKDSALTMRMGYRKVSLSYEEVYDLSRKVALLLEREGLKKGDKVMLLAPNSPFWICVYWGCLLRGCLLVPLDVGSTPELVKKVAVETEAKLFFKHTRFVHDISSVSKTYDIELLAENLEGIDVSRYKKQDVGSNDIALIMYTSGTTGTPKGVELSHKNIYSNVNEVSRLIPVSKQDRFLSILPLSHMFEQVSGFLLPSINGAHIIYPQSLSEIRSLLKEYRIAKMVAVPEFLKVIMSKIESTAREEGREKILSTMLGLSSRIPFLSVRRLLFHSVHKKFGGSLHTVASGGAPLSVETERKWSALGVHILQGYGLTETSPIVSANTYKEHREGSVGKVLPGVDVHIATDGEILVKGPNVFRGYFKDVEKTKEVLSEDGWFHTDDLGEIDKDGFLFIKGRKKYMILGSGGQNVYPEDIEFELNKLDGVKDSCVVGLPGSGGSVQVHAVLLGDIKDPKSVLKEANSHLASHQQISDWSIWPDEDFPRSATRKVKKGEVLRWLDVKKGEAEKAQESMGVTELTRLLAEVTGTDIATINDGTNIVRDLNLDSLLRVELVARIEEKFGVFVDESLITTSTTVSELKKMIDKKEVPKEKAPLKHWPRFKWVTVFRMVGQLLIIFPIARIFVKLRVEGKENLKDITAPVIFMPNHQSYLDSLALLMAVPFRIRKKLAFAAARDVVYEMYRRFILLTEFWFNIFPFPRKEGEDIKSGLDFTGKLLDDGWSIVLYPEGELSESGELLPFKRGSGLVATQMNAPVVPVKIIGTRDIMPYAKLKPEKRGTVTVRFGKPLAFSQTDSYIKATEKIETKLRGF